MTAFLGIMQTEAERMNRLIDDLLSLSRVEAEERMRPTGPVCLDALVGETVRGMTQLATEAGVTLEPRCPATRSPFRAMPTSCGRCWAT